MVVLWKCRQSFTRQTKVLLVKLKSIVYTLNNSKRLKLKFAVVFPILILRTRLDNSKILASITKLVEKLLLFSIF